MLLNELYEDYGELILTPADFDDESVYQELRTLIDEKDATQVTNMVKEMTSVNRFALRVVGLLFEDASRKFDTSVNQIDGLILLTIGTVPEPQFKVADIAAHDFDYHLTDDEARVTVTLADLSAQKISWYQLFSELAEPITRPKRVLPKLFKAVVDEVPISYQAQLLDLAAGQFELIGQLAAEPAVKSLDPQTIDHQEETRAFKFATADQLLDFTLRAAELNQKFPVYRLDTGDLVALVPLSDDIAQGIAREYGGEMMAFATAYVREHGQQVQ